MGFARLSLTPVCLSFFRRHLRKTLHGQGSSSEQLSSLWHPDPRLAAPNCPNSQTSSKTEGSMALHLGFWPGSWNHSRGDGLGSCETHSVSFPSQVGLCCPPQVQHLNFYCPDLISSLDHSGGRSSRPSHSTRLEQPSQLPPHFC